LTETSKLIMQTLQAQWSLVSPGVNDIYWVDTRVETLDFAKVSKNFVISCYSPTGPSTTVPLSREAWLKTEHVIVDLIVKVIGTVDDAVTVRENVRKEVERIIHANELNMPGLADAPVTREPYQVEGPDLVRVSIQISCRSFQIKS